MNSRERMAVAMRGGVPDRVPLMCQLSLGHYFLNSGLDAIDIWHSTAGFSEALLLLQQRYGFDGILTNLPGRDPKWREYVASIEQRESERWVRWKNGWYTVVPDADNAHVYRGDGSGFEISFEEVDPEKLFYVDPHDLSGITYPYTWGFETKPAPRGKDFFPPWHYDTIKYVRDRAPDVSVHGEIFSPFSQLIDLLGLMQGMLSLRRSSEKVKACLDALSEGAIELAHGQARAGADAILISSAYAGGALISRKQYEEFVLPYEAKVIAGIKRQFDLPVYTHTCGEIGDRLDLMMQTGTNGIDTLDPPPLGTVNLADAKQQTAGKIFLKGNLDPVQLLTGTAEEISSAAKERLTIGAPGGGYILSTACSVSPGTPPGNILLLREAVERWGHYRE